jgi:hypothetical protein
MSPTNSIRGTTQRKLSDRSTRLARQRGVQAATTAHPLPGGSLGEPEAVTLGDNDAGVVQEPVDRGGGQGFRHDLVESRGVQVGADGERAAFVGGVDQSVEPFGGVRADREQPDVVDDDQVGADQPGRG